LVEKLETGRELLKAKATNQKHKRPQRPRDNPFGKRKNRGIKNDRHMATLIHAAILLFLETEAK
jgi:hypothetical protein